MIRLKSTDKIFLSPYNTMTIELKRYLKRSYGITTNGFIDNSKEGINIYKPYQVPQLNIDKILILSPNYEIEIFNNLVNYIPTKSLVVLTPEFKRKNKLSIFVKQKINHLFNSFSNIFSKYNIKISILWTNRVGEFLLGNEILLRKIQLEHLPKNQKYFLLFTGKDKDIANKFLYKMYKRTFTKYKNIYLIENKLLVSILQRLLKKQSFHACHYFNMKCESNEYELITTTKPSIKFTTKELKEGNQLLKELHISKPYVCIFARDSAYLKKEFPNTNWNYHNYRDTDIDSYKLAAEYLIEKGYTVVRFGSIVEKPFSYKHEKCIDYPFTKYSSDFMDIFLIAQCEAIMGSSSGATDIATAFGITHLGINLMPIDYTPISTPQDLFIPKKLKRNGEYLSLKQYIKLTEREQIFHAATYNKLQIEIEDNTPEEIRDLCKEFLEKDCYNTQYDLQNKYYEIHSENIRTGSIKTKIGSQFLLDNKWYIDETD